MLVAGQPLDFGEVVMPEFNLFLETKRAVAVEGQTADVLGGPCRVFPGATFAAVEWETYFAPSNPGAPYFPARDTSIGEGFSPSRREARSRARGLFKLASLPQERWTNKTGASGKFR